MPSPVLPGRLRASERADALSYALLAIMPLGMALLNRSAPVLLVAAALAAALGRAIGSEGAALAGRLRTTARSPLGTASLLFLGFAAVSIAWSDHGRTSAAAYGELLLALGAASLLQAALPRAVPAWAVKLATVAIALGCLTVVAELATGMTARAALGLRTDTFIFKRSVTAILIGLWPVAILLWAERKGPIAAAALVLLGIASVAAHSSATLLGIAAGLSALAVTLLSRRAAGLAFAGFFVVSLAVAPILGDLADRILPPRFVERLAFAHARERIDIWQSFGEAARRRPLFGEGFGTSPVMDREPVAAEVPAERRLMLGAWHPHNAYLQVWAEMGLVGALLAGTALLLLARAVARAGPWPARAAAATIGSAATIMWVGHGAWQGWWIAMLGAAAIWTSRLPAPVPRPYAVGPEPSPLKPVAST